MTPEALAPWATWAGAVIALVALFFIGVAARAAHQQTALQRRVHEETMSPYVWADIRPDDQQGQMFVLVVGNSGPTLAQTVSAAHIVAEHGAGLKALRPLRGRALPEP